MLFLIRFKWNLFAVVLYIICSVCQIKDSRKEWTNILKVNFMYQTIINKHLIELNII